MQAQRHEFLYQSHPKERESFFDKFCQLCKEHGGPLKTHNTSDCLKFKKDGAKKKGFTKPFKSQKKDGNSFAQLTEKLSKLKKIVKKATKKSSCKRKRRDDSDDSNSDDE
jgi:hypothetical protein